MTTPNHNADTRTPKYRYECILMSGATVMVEMVNTIDDHSIGMWSTSQPNGALVGALSKDGSIVMVRFDQIAAMREVPLQP